jgi:hypothetical protein
LLVEEFPPPLFSKGKCEWDYVYGSLEIIFMFEVSSNSHKTADSRLPIISWGE